MRHFVNLSLIAFLSSLVLACTSSPNLDSYPERQIDRPYTLPDDVATWTTFVSASQVDDGEGQVGASVYPFFWEQALSDKWTLEYSPLPLAVRYQIANTERNLWGLRFGSGIGYSSFSGVMLQPQVGVYHRYKMGGSYAWETTVAYTRVFSDKNDRDEQENGRLTTGPMVQIDDTKVLLPKIGLGMSRNDLAQYSEYRDYTGDDDFMFYAPASLSFRWLFHRQWEYSMGYAVNSLVLEEDRLAVHTLNASFKHFW